MPYSPETAASGVRRTLQPNQWLHYQRMFTPPDGVGGCVLLHFGAVDNDCVILVNHREVGRHSGGYWPFSLDITDYLQDGENRCMSPCRMRPTAAFRRAASRN